MSGVLVSSKINNSNQSQSSKEKTQSKKTMRSTQTRQTENVKLPPSSHLDSFYDAAGNRTWAGWRAGEKESKYKNVTNEEMKLLGNTHPYSPLGQQQLAEIRAGGGTSGAQAKKIEQNAQFAHNKRNIENAQSRDNRLAYAEGGVHVTGRDLSYLDMTTYVNWLIGVWKGEGIEAFNRRGLVYNASAKIAQRLGADMDKYEETVRNENGEAVKNANYIYDNDSRANVGAWVGLVVSVVGIGNILGVTSKATGFITRTIKNITPQWVKTILNTVGVGAISKVISKASKVISKATGFIMRKIKNIIPQRVKTILKKEVGYSGLRLRENIKRAGENLSRVGKNFKVVEGTGLSKVLAKPAGIILEKTGNILAGGGEFAQKHPYKTIGSTASLGFLLLVLNELVIEIQKQNGVSQDQTKDIGD